MNHAQKQELAALLDTIGSACRRAAKILREVTPDGAPVERPKLSQEEIRAEARRDLQRRGLLPPDE